MSTSINVYLPHGQAIALLSAIAGMPGLDEARAVIGDAISCVGEWSTSLMDAINRSAETGQAVFVAGDCHEDALQLIDDGLAVVSDGDAGCAVLTGDDPYDRPYTVVLVDMYAHELRNA